MRKKAAKLRKMNFFKKKCLNYLQIQKLFCIFVALFVGRNISQRFGWGGRPSAKQAKTTTNTYNYTLYVQLRRKQTYNYTIYIIRYGKHESLVRAVV